jgi:F0F1-type ATP synthase assembly protein I
MVPQEPDGRQLGTYYAIAQVGIEMVVPIGIGWWADQRLGSAPWLLVTGVILGFALGIWHLVALTRDRGTRDESSRRGKEP